MPETWQGLSEDRELVPDDVLMIARQMRDKRTNKAFTWRFFLVVTEHDEWSDLIHGMVVGTEHEKLRIEPLRINIDDPKNEIQFVPEDEWPPGVVVFRMGMILKRQIEGI